MKSNLKAAIAAALLLSPMAAMACSSCGCTLSTDWDSQGLATKPGLRFDIRYDYLNQSQLRSGGDEVDRDSIPLPAEREIELGTVNRYTTLGMDYSQGDWGLNLQLPYVYRTHSTYPEDETELSTSQTSGIGDARVMFRYQGLSAQKDVGLQIGLELPTGRYDERFRTGSEAGEPLDRGLQPGSGTTDLLLGVFKFGPMSQRFDYFAQALVQTSLNSRDEYRPGNSLNLNFGVRYLVSDKLVPELQVNARKSTRDSGAQADRENSGGTLVDLSPGLSLELGERMHAFAFVQIPVYQHVNGLQLAPRFTASLGMRYDLR